MLSACVNAASGMASVWLWYVCGLASIVNALFIVDSDERCDCSIGRACLNYDERIDCSIGRARLNSVQSTLRPLHSKRDSR